ncbi:MAG TPA: undecaprenyl-phosphate glucose phosphotransferase [Gallionella sp.]|nr:undecaprenyl-phosphate glucose phosphotransferase [Gallionella sp.]
MIQLPGGLIRPHNAKLSFLHRVLDGGVIAVSLYACNLALGVPPTIYYGLAGTLAVLLFLLFAEIKGVYHSWRLDPIGREVNHVLIAWMLVVCSLVILAFLSKTSEIYSRRVILVWLVLAPTLLALFRVSMRFWLHALRKRGRNTRTVAFAGSSKLVNRLMAQIESAPWMGLQLSGVYDDQHHEDLPVRGGLSALVEDVRSGKIDYVYITLPSGEEKRIAQLVNDLADTTATVCVVPDLFVFDLLHARWSSIGGIPVVNVFESPFYGVDGWMKRAEDLILGFLILMLAIFPMLLIAIGVKLTSSGPVLFRQRRYGLNGEVIEVLKFRTMRVCEDGASIPQARNGDPRITRFGAFLRRRSLDELPQFFNVLQGTMSIVGPRPHAVAHNEQYRQLIHGYMLRHKVKPGITGWAQVNGWRGETDTLDKMRRRIEFDLAYMRDWSLWLDIKIIFLTIFTGFSGKNAY